MDYFNLIKNLQEKFMENPRQGITNFLKEQEESFKKIGDFRVSANSLLILKEFHKEYANIVGGLLKSNILDLSKLQDNLSSISIIQRLHEWAEVVGEYQLKGANEIIALRLSKAYAASMEVMWGMLKRMVSFAGLNPENKHLNIPLLLNKLKKIEENYNINIPNIKNYVDSTLRNFIGHENTVFIPPNIISFLDVKGKESKEVMRLSTDEMYSSLLNTLPMLVAFKSVENSAIASRIQFLLKLSDEELNDYMKTGILTEEMKKKMGFI